MTGARSPYRRTGPVVRAAARRISTCFIITLALAGGLFGQGEIGKSRSQLEKLRSEIGSFEKKIREKEKKENTTLGQLDNYTRQERLLRTLIRKLQNQENDLERSVDSARRSIDELTEQIAHLRGQYAGYVRNVYTRGSAADIELLLTSRSLNQLLRRSEYLKRFSSQRKRDLDSIASKLAALERTKALLDDRLRAQQKLIGEKSGEKDRLQKMSRKKKNVLAAIRRDKKNYRREIDRRKRDFTEIEKKIAALIEAEAARKRATGKGAGKSAVPSSGAFSASRGRLRWPVDGGRVLTRFGNQRHPVLNTVTESKGIDIGVPAGSPIATVAEGEVSTIWWLPSYGNLVIVAHDGGYRTVYAYLSGIDVDEGERVAAGQVIGRSGEGLDGPMLHFEVWKGRDTEDPEKWLMNRSLSRQ